MTHHRLFRGAVIVGALAAIGLLGGAAASPGRAATSTFVVNSDQDVGGTCTFEMCTAASSDRDRERSARPRQCLLRDPSGWPSLDKTCESTP
jgi:hypothetical protein